MGYMRASITESMNAMKKSALLCGLVLSLVGVAAQAAESITVFAAASLADVMEKVGAAYAKESGTPVRFSFAASSALARQIESGAPAGVFVSADEEWMDYVTDRGLVRADTRIDIAGNALVLVAPADSPLQLRIAPGFALAQALGTRGRIAMGDPESVPAGKYARDALRSLGVWDSVASRIVPAESVRAALAFVSLGEVPLGVVYATDARGNSKVRVVDAFPASTHAPVTYPAAATRRGGQAAAGFVKFLRGSQAQAIFARYGFTPP
jgi:molybdate transport system substrate-binding protein